MTWLLYMMKMCEDAIRKEEKAVQCQSICLIQAATRGHIKMTEGQIETNNTEMTNRQTENRNYKY